MYQGLVVCSHCILSLFLMFWYINILWKTIIKKLCVQNILQHICRDKWIGTKNNSLGVSSTAAPYIVRILWHINTTENICMIGNNGPIKGYYKKHKSQKISNLWISYHHHHSQREKAQKRVTMFIHYIEFPQASRVHMGLSFHFNPHRQKWCWQYVEWHSCS